MKNRTLFSREGITAMSIVIVAAIIPLSGFHPSPTGNLDEEKYHLFVMALNNISTFNYFTVITVKDLRSNKVKEICTKGNFLSGAIHRELGAGYDLKGQKKAMEWGVSKRNRYFEFNSSNALENISFFEYDTKMVQVVQKKYDFDAIVNQIRATKRFSIRLEDKEMKAFAHILFNKGYLTGESSCWGGELVYVDPSSKFAAEH